MGIVLKVGNERQVQCHGGIIVRPKVIVWAKRVRAGVHCEVVADIGGDFGLSRMPDITPPDKMPDPSPVANPDKELGLREVCRVGIEIYGCGNPLRQLGHGGVVVDISVNQERIQLLAGKSLEDGIPWI